MQVDPGDRRILRGGALRAINGLLHACVGRVLYQYAVQFAEIVFRKEVGPPGNDPGRIHGTPNTPDFLRRPGCKRVEVRGDMGRGFPVESGLARLAATVR